MTIKNFFVNEIERSRYRALADRIVDFNTYIGGLPPILGIVEPGFVRNPLDDTHDPRLTIDDRLPIPRATDLPITAAEYASVLHDELRLDRGISGAITWDISAASADPENWTAAGTYGHPGLDAALSHYVARRPARLAVATDSETGLAVIATKAEQASTRLLHTMAEVSSINLSSDDPAREVAEGALSAERGCRLAMMHRFEYQASPDTRRAGIRADYIRLVREIAAVRLGFELSTAGSSPTARQALSNAIDHQEALHYLPALQAKLHISDAELFDGITPFPTTQIGYGKALTEFIDTATSIFERYRSL